MDRTADPLTTGDYRLIIKQIMTDYATEYPEWGKGAKTQTMTDDVGGHYQIWYTGWDGEKRIRYCVLHIDIIEGKIWVQHDGIYEGITHKILEAGVPHKQIVIGFHSPGERKHTPFALA